MQIIARRLAPLLIAATSLTPIAAHAGSFYVFGDSLADNGNITRTYGVPSFAYIEGSNAQYYYDSHFSNGPTWAEDLPGLTGLSFSTGNDYAVGGAFTGPLQIGNSVYNNISNEEGLPFPLPNFLQEIASFAAAGGHFGAGDVAGVWIGANNYFIAATEAQHSTPLEASTIIQDAVLQDVAQTEQGVGELIGLGARTLIVQNLPPLGATPNFNSDGPGTIGAADEISSLHDEFLAGSMEGLHDSTGANIIVVNEAQLFDEVLANPAAYGKTDVTDACVNSTVCRSAPLAQQNQYLFWDNVHPTAGTHELIAEYTAADLNGFRALSNAAVMSSFGSAAFSSAMTARMSDLQAGATGFAINLPQQQMVADIGANDANLAPTATGLSGFITGNYDYGNRTATATSSGFKYSAGTFAVGVDHRVAPGIALGAAFGYGTDSATGDYGAKLSADAYQFGGYATFFQPDFYLNIKGSIAFNDYNNTRPAVLAGVIRAKPTGYTYDFGGEMGYLMHCDYASFGPVAGLDAANTHIGSYTESGDPALIQTVDSQDYQRVIADAGLAATMNLPVGGLLLHPRVSATVDDLLSGNGGNFDSVFTDEPAVTLTTVYPKATHYWGELSGGVSANISPRITLTADFSSTVAKSDGEDHEVSASLHYLF